MKSYFNQIYKIIFLLLLTNISNLYAHNLFNGGCKEHCGQKVKVISNKNKLKNIDEKINLYADRLPILKDDTINIIEYVEQSNDKKKKKFNFWKLLENDE